MGPELGEAVGEFVGSVDGKLVGPELGEAVGEFVGPVDGE